MAAYTYEDLLSKVPYLISVVFMHKPVSEFYYGMEADFAILATMEIHFKGKVITVDGIWKGTKRNTALCELINEIPQEIEALERQGFQAVDILDDEYSSHFFQLVNSMFKAICEEGALDVNTVIRIIKEVRKKLGV